MYIFRADQVYKGTPAAEFEVASNADGPACGYTFTAGSRYLVFASDRASVLVGGDPGVPLSTSLCAGNQPVRPGDQPLREEDGIHDDDSLTGELLAELGRAVPPPTASTSTPMTETAAISAAGGSSGGAAVPWPAVVSVAVVVVLISAGWRGLPAPCELSVINHCPAQGIGPRRTASGSAPAASRVHEPFERGGTGWGRVSRSVAALRARSCRRSYRAVVAGDACPTRDWAVARSTPASRSSPT